MSTFHGPLRAVRRAGATLAVLLLFGLSGRTGACADPATALQIADGSPHADLIQRVYAKIPAAWKPSRHVVVTEVSNNAMTKLVASTGGFESEQDDSSVDGCYEGADEDPDEEAIITLRQAMRPSDVAFVFSHEYGHLIWDEVLTAAQRAAYTRLWRQQKRAHHLVTEYATDSREEGFAESVATFLRFPSRLRHRDSRSYGFLTALLAHA